MTECLNLDQFVKYSQTDAFADGVATNSQESEMLAVWFELPSEQQNILLGLCEFEAPSAPVYDIRDKQIKSSSKAQ